MKKRNAKQLHGLGLVAIASTNELSLAGREAVESDRVYFLRHPEARYRFREVIPGEFDTPGKTVCILGKNMLVEQVFPGHRIRRPVGLVPVRKEGEP